MKSLFVVVIMLTLSAVGFCGGCGRNAGPKNGYTQYVCTGVGDGTGVVYGLCYGPNCNVQGSYGGGAPYLVNGYQNGVATGLGFPTFTPLSNLPSSSLGGPVPTMNDAQHYWDDEMPGGQGCGDQHDHDSC